MPALTFLKCKNIDFAHVEIAKRGTDTVESLAATRRTRGMLKEKFMHTQK